MPQDKPLETTPFPAAFVWKVSAPHRDLRAVDEDVNISRLEAAARGVEAEIVAFIPTTLVEAVEKAVWCAKAYRLEADAYLYDHADGDENNPLLAALEAIGRATA